MHNTESGTKYTLFLVEVDTTGFDLASFSVVLVGIWLGKLNILYISFKQGLMIAAGQLLKPGGFLYMYGVSRLCCLFLCGCHQKFDGFYTCIYRPYSLYCESALSLMVSIPVSIDYIVCIVSQL